MSKEVEDALYMLLHCSLKDTEYETQKEQFKVVYDYIKKLQQENKQLKIENTYYKYKVVGGNDKIQDLKKKYKLGGKEND